MPQMAPLNWLTLFIAFCLILIIFSTMNYWIFLYAPKPKLVKKLTHQLNWKW